MNNIGIIGTGAIGLPIAKRIINAGYKLNFYARKNYTINELIEYGGSYFDDIKKVGENSNIIFLFVRNYEDCFDCIKELLVEMNKGIIVIGATIAPTEIIKLNELCSDKNIDLVSAPVTGGVQGAETGTLITIISGDSHVVSQLNNVISSYSKEIIFLGNSLSLAFSMKALVQYLVAVNTITLTECYLLGVNSGLDPNFIYKVIVNSSGSSKIFESRFPTIMKEDFHKRGTIEIMAKDLNIVMDMSKTSGTPLLLGTLTKNLFDVSNYTLNNEEDFSAIFKLYKKMIKKGEM